MLKVAAITLAAGQGTRMKSKRAKVLHPVAGLPMVSHVMHLVQSLDFEKNLVIVGHQAETVSAVVEGLGGQCIYQKERRGTGDAVLQAKDALQGFLGPVLILNGDTPLLTTESIRRFLQDFEAQSAIVGLLTVSLEQPFGYGRIVRNAAGEMLRIVEEKDATLTEKEIQEVNTGVYLCDATFLFEALSQVQPNNNQQEYYLTDIIGLAVAQGKKMMTSSVQKEEVLGINSRADLAVAEGILRARLNASWMKAGVSLPDPSQVYIDATVKTIGMDTVLYPGVHLQGDTEIGEGVEVYASRIRDSKIANGVTIKSYCVIEGAEIECDVSIGPFAHLRPGTVLRAASKVGNFVEIKKTVLGFGSKASHLSYLGDAEIGDKVNIGAGTITCNYDGVNKFKTIIEDDVFIGSDSQLVAPVVIGQGATIAAGTTVTRDVPADALSISRLKQENKDGWAKRQRALQVAKKSKKKR